MLVGFGDADEHQHVVDRIRAALPPLFDVVTPMPFTEVQQLEDEANAWGFCCYDKSGYFAELTDEVIDVLTDHVPQKTSPLSILLFYRLDERYCEVGEDETGLRRRAHAAVDRLLHRADPHPGHPAGGAGVDPVAVGGAPPAHARGRHLRQRSGCRRPGRGPGELRPQVRPPRRREGRLRPGNLFHRNINIPAPAVPSQREAT